MFYSNPGLYAVMVKAHMYKYGTIREQLVKIEVKNHEHGFKNSNAQYQIN